jgi:putative transposase
MVLRHENAVLWRHVGRVRYEPADRAWFAALARLTVRALGRGLPRDALDAAGMAPQAGGGKYDTSKRRKPGRPPTSPGIARLPGLH